MLFKIDHQIIVLEFIIIEFIIKLFVNVLTPINSKEVEKARKRYNSQKLTEIKGSTNIKNWIEVIIQQ